MSSVVTAPVVATPAVSDAPAPAATPAAPQAPARIKVGDAEYDPADIQAALDGRRNIGASLKEVAEQKAALERFRDPKQLRAIMKEFGHDASKFAEDLMIEEAERAAKDPKDLELEELKAFKKSKEDAEAQTKQEKLQAEAKAYVDKVMAAQEQQVVLEAAKAGLPRTGAALKRVLSLMHTSAKAQLEMPAAQAVQIAKDEMLVDHKALLGEFGVEQLMQFLPEKVVQELVKHVNDKAISKAAESDPNKQIAAPKPKGEAAKMPDWLYKEIYGNAKRQ